MTNDAPTLLVCTHRRLGGAGSCGGSGSEDVVAALRRHLAERGLGWTVHAATCLGYCRSGPNLKAAPGGPLVHGCHSDRVAELVDRLLAEWGASGGR